MGIRDLENFLNQKQKEVKENTVNWEKRKNDWLVKVSEFFETISTWLEPFEQKKLLTKKLELINKNEEYIGSYNIDRMVLFFSNNNNVILEPMGTLVVGAYGRIDMIGKNGKIRFVLVDKDSDTPKVKITFSDSKNKITKKIDKNKKTELAWKIATFSPNIRYITLNQDSFSDVLLDMLK